MEKIAIARCHLGNLKNVKYFSKLHEINIKCHKMLTRDQNFWIMSVHFARIRSWKLWICQCTIPFQNVNSGPNISQKRFYLFINRPNVVMETAFSEAGFCTLAISNVPVMISTGKSLVLWNFTYFNIVCVCIVVRNISPRKASADGKISGLFCEPLTKIICICMCNAH